LVSALKKVCFIEMEGVLLSDRDYRANERRAKSFAGDLSAFCREHGIGLYLVTGFHEPVAHEKLDSGFLRDLFDDKHFLHVDEAYITEKGGPDEKIHRDSLEKDPEFNDSYFKQVVMQRVLAERHLFPKDALLLSDDLWVDGYYTMRFSKADFAMFEENLLDRGRKAERIPGLAYFSLDFASARKLLESFPQVSYAGLDKFVYDSMKKALLGENTMSTLVNAVKEKQLGQQKGPSSQERPAQGPDETIIFDDRPAKAHSGGSPAKKKGKKKR
jgi:hypothetical protein